MSLFGLISRSRVANAQNHMRRARRSTTRSHLAIYVSVPTNLVRSTQQECSLWQETTSGLQLRQRVDEGLIDRCCPWPLFHPIFVIGQSDDFAGRASMWDPVHSAQNLKGRVWGS